ncbi:ABC transporter transmembrane domain-containing protein [Aquimarina mytili]|uniref:ABC transporter ATP-binding protein n=1 Tax=Aquimarina mytili TaxID=874423 RepID=A0A936ZVU8_9FLAO|nr:ABC transporter ATP-binding protein [Aquimarina mytili]MBL0682868.1 ABC transporter ATP-binding protein [Aquimarina mytili]
MSYTKWSIINTFAAKNIILVTLTLFTGLLYNVLTILIPISIGKFYELSFGFSSHRLAAFKFIPFMDAPDFNSFLVFFFSLVILRLLFEYLNRFGIGLIGERFSKTLREQLFTNQLQISMDVYDKKGIGKYLLRYSGDLKSIQNYMKNGLIRFAQDVVLLGIVVVAIGYFDTLLGVIIACCILISSLVLWGINKALYTVSLERRNKRSGMLSFVNTRLRGIMALKAFNKYRPEEKRYQKRSDNLYNIGKRYVKIVAFLQAIIPAITYGMLGIIMVYVFSSTHDDITKSFQGASLLVLILLIISILPVLRRSLRVSIIWKLGDISFSKLIAIFSLPKENQLPFEEIALGHKEIIFKDVIFGYPDTNKPVFKDLKLSIPPQNTILFQGKSGSGKSTFIRLLLKLMSPSKGQILYGDHCCSELSEKTIRKNVAIVSKDFPLYGRDVYEAIVYNRKEHNKEKAKFLLEHLQQHEDAKNQLQLGSKIGDMGCNLTSGQQKILMYCRALLTRKPILILEEPLKELNTKTQKLLLHMLKSIQDQKTLILLDDHKVQGFDIDKVHYF